MTFLEILRRWIGLDPVSKTRIDQISRDNPLFVYIKIPGNLGPMDRGEKYEDPLNAALDKEKLGETTGGGSLLGQGSESGNLSIQFCGIDVDLYDAARGLALLRRELVRLRAPEGTMLIYELDGQAWEEPVYRKES
jgi:hypothetical protein